MTMGGPESPEGPETEGAGRPSSRAFPLARELTDDGLDPLRQVAKGMTLRLVEREVDSVFRLFMAFCWFRFTPTTNSAWAHREMMKPPDGPAWFMEMYERAGR